jgi:ATP-binding cassette subfamily B protein
MFEFTMVCVLQIIQSILSLMLPTYNADIISNGVVNGDTKYILRTGTWMLVFAGIQVIASIFSVYFSAKIALNIGREIRKSVYEKVNDFSEVEVQKFGVPSLITRTTNDVQQIQLVLYTLFSLIIMSPIVIVSGVVLTYTHDKFAVIVLLITLPILCAFILTLAKIALPIFKKIQKIIDAINRVLREQLNGIRIIRAFTRDKY